MVDKEIEQDICRDYQQNEKIRVIAQSYNVTQATVMAVLRRNNIPLRDRKRIIPDIEEAVTALYRSGKSINEIMQLTGVKSQQTIYRILRDHNVDRRYNIKSKS